MHKIRTSFYLSLLNYMSTTSCICRKAKHELDSELIKHGVLELLYYLIVPQRLKSEEPLPSV